MDIRQFAFLVHSTAGALLCTLPTLRFKREVLLRLEGQCHLTLP